MISHDWTLPPGCPPNDGNWWKGDLQRIRWSTAMRHARRLSIASAFAPIAADGAPAFARRLPRPTASFFADQTRRHANVTEVSPRHLRQLATRLLSRKPCLECANYEADPFRYYPRQRRSCSTGTCLNIEGAIACFEGSRFGCVFHELFQQAFIAMRAGGSVRWPCSLSFTAMVVARSLPGRD